MNLKAAFMIAFISMAISACGIFHKSCNCPHFSSTTKKAMTEKMAVGASRLNKTSRS